MIKSASSSDLGLVLLLIGREDFPKGFTLETPPGWRRNYLFGRILSRECTERTLIGEEWHTNDFCVRALFQTL